MDQADAQGTRGVEALARREERPSVRLADLGDHERADHRGQDAEARLRETETRTRLGDYEVTHRAEAHAAAERRAVDAGDDRHRAPINCVEHLRHDHRILLVLLLGQTQAGAHPGHVRAGAEGRPGASQDDGAQLIGWLIGQLSKSLA